MCFILSMLGVISCIVLIAMFLDWFGNHPRPPSDPYDY